MPNITRSPADKPVPTRTREAWDPFRIMRDLMRWDPFGETASFAWPGKMTAEFDPDFEVREGKDSFTFKADLPGVQDKDLEIHLTGNRLTISGKREAEKEDKGDAYYTCERTYGSFTRVFTLPDGIDGEHVAAALKDGVLTIVLPKKPEVQPKRIAVTPQAKQS